jgi:predicted TIM-barrel fold metal-dependent hydrolase
MPTRNGVLDRFPKLNIAFLEAGVGFLPYWMERFAEKYLKRKSEMEQLKMLPSQYENQPVLFYL